MTKAFLVTGNALFSTEWRVVLSIPKSQLDWVYETFLGMLDNATKEAAWVTGGETDPDEAAAIFEQILDGIIMYPTRVGEVFCYTSITPPSGCLLCDGSTYLKANYPDLAAVLAGTALDINSTQFKVPNHNGRPPRGTTTQALIGQLVGAANVTLSVANLPSHSHTEVTAVPSVGAAITGVPVPSAVPGVGVTGATGAGTAVTINPLTTNEAFMIVAKDPWNV